MRHGGRFSERWMTEVYDGWECWQRGIVPNRGGGRGAQNPRLLAAFQVLDRVRQKIEAKSG